MPSSNNRRTFQVGDPTMSATCRVVKISDIANTSATWFVTSLSMMFANLLRRKEANYGGFYDEFYDGMRAEQPTFRGLKKLARKTKNSGRKTQILRCRI